MVLDWWVCSGCLGWGCLSRYDLDGWLVLFDAIDSVCICGLRGDWWLVGVGLVSCFVV